MIPWFLSIKRTIDSCKENIADQIWSRFAHSIPQNGILQTKIEVFSVEIESRHTTQMRK